LAIGNVLNRGTSRSTVTAVTLPDALLKLDELRSSAPGGEDVPQGRPDTLLDFVAQAVVNGSAQEQASLCAAIEGLICKTRTAQTVSLEDVEANCRKISQQAAKAREGIAVVPESPAVARLSDNVRRIHEEAEFALMLVENAKKELLKSLQWSCVKTKIKSDEWFGSWSQLLEQMLGAIGKAQPKGVSDSEHILASKVSETREVPIAVLRDASMGGAHINRRQSSTGRRASNCGVATNIVPGVKGGMHAPPRCPPAKTLEMKLDDEARFESIDLGLTQPSKAKQPSLFGSFEDKENSCH